MTGAVVALPSLVAVPGAIRPFAVVAKVLLAKAAGVLFPIELCNVRMVRSI